MAKENFEKEKSQLKTNVVESVRLGYDQCARIADYLNARPEDVYRALGDLVFESRVERYEKGGRTLYRLPGARAAEAAAENAPAPKPAPEKLEEKILDAIAEAPRTLSQIKNVCGIHFSVDISERIENLSTSRKIRGISNGNITAYFPYGKKPLRFWLSGNGSVEAEYESGFNATAEDEREETHRRQIRETLESETQSFVEIGKARPHSRRAIEIDEEALERAAARSSTMESTAAALGIGLSTLQAKLRKHPVLKAAYQRGNKTFHANIQKTLPEAPDIKPAEAKKKKAARRRSSNANYTAEMFEQFGAEGLSQKQIADRLGKDHSTVCHQLSKPEFRASYQRGLKQFDEKFRLKIPDPDFLEAPPVPSNSAEAVSESRIDLHIIEVSDQSPIKAAKSVVDSIIEDTEAEAPEEENRQALEIIEVPPLPETPDRGFAIPVFISQPFNNQIEPSPDSTKTVPIGKGSLSLALEVNLFETSKDERDFLCDLINRVQEFEAKRRNDD